MDWRELRQRLAIPFPASAVKFRPGTSSRDKKRAQALAYADSRVYEDRLNEVLGPNWSCRYRTWGERRLICELSIRIQDEQGEVKEITRASSGEWGEKDKIAQGTSAEAQAFKRACSKFGLGRYLYDIPVIWAGYDDHSRRLTETPRLPATFLPQLGDVGEPEPEEPVKLDSKRASALHRELGKLLTITSKEHNHLAGEKLERPIDSFTGLTEAEGLAVLRHAERVDVARRRKGSVNPEKQDGKTRLRA